VSFRRVAIAAGLIAATAATAHATPPGRDGPIAFERARLHTNRSEIFVADADGRAARRVSHAPPETFDGEPDWSRDGRRITFERCPADGGTCSVWVVGADGSGERQISPSCRAECPDASGPAFAPDGGHVAYVRSSGPVKQHSPAPDDNQIERSELVVADLAGGPDRVVLPLGDFRGDLVGPQFSPDGRRIVFARHNSWLARPAGGTALFAVGVDGSHLRRLTAWSLNAGGHADWSPDGRRILFRTLGGDGGRLFTIGADGRDVRLVTRMLPPADDEHALANGSFSPDGRWIVLATTAGAADAVRGLADVFVVRVDGTGLRNVTRSPNLESSPDWGGR